MEANITKNQNQNQNEISIEKRAENKTTLLRKNHGNQEKQLMQYFNNQK